MYIPVLGCGCHPQTAADGISGHWTTWAMHLVNGVSCWHHPIPKVGNPDVHTSLGLRLSPSDGSRRYQWTLDHVGHAPGEWCELLASSDS